MPRSALCLSIALAAVSFPGPATADPDREIQETADLAIHKLEREGYAGSVLVARDGEIKYFRNSGIENCSACTPSYWISSVTKQFTATAILLLHQRKKLDIQDSINVYLPDVPEEMSGITLFHLLTHTSGLAQRYAADGITGRTTALKSLLATKLQSEPGNTFDYANDNYNLLAIIVEIQSGMSYEEFLHTAVFEPAGMKNSGFWGTPIESGTCVPPVAVPLDAGDMIANWGFRGAVGIRASVRDLFAFMQTLLAKELLTEKNFELLMGNHLQLPSGTEIGFNWFGQRTDQGIYAKNSRGYDSFGGNAVIYYYPKQRLTIITATNAGPAETGDGPVEGWSRKTHAALADLYVTN